VEKKNTHQKMLKKRDKITVILLIIVHFIAVACGSLELQQEGVEVRSSHQSAEASNKVKSLGKRARSKILSYADASASVQVEISSELSPHVLESLADMSSEDNLVKQHSAEEAVKEEALKEHQYGLFDDSSLIIVQKLNKTAEDSQIWPLDKGVVQGWGHRYKDQTCDEESEFDDNPERMQCVHDPVRKTYTAFSCDAEFWSKTVYTEDYAGCQGIQVSGCRGRIGICTSCGLDFTLITKCAKHEKTISQVVSEGIASGIDTITHSKSIGVSLKVSRILIVAVAFVTTFSIR